MSIKVLFVCLGNICRSPTADGVFRKLVSDSRLSGLIEVDSAGTAGWHQGRKPDVRSIATAAKFGYDLTELRARQLIKQDFDEYDYILAMDAQNLKDVKEMMPSAYQGHVGLFLDFVPGCGYREVPDPYYGNQQDFDLVVDLVEQAASRLLDHILQEQKKS